MPLFVLGHLLWRLNKLRKSLLKRHFVISVWWSDIFEIFLLTLDVIFIIIQFLSFLRDAILREVTQGGLKFITLATPTEVNVIVIGVALLLKLLTVDILQHVRYHSMIKVSIWWELRNRLPFFVENDHKNILLAQNGKLHNLFENAFLPFAQADFASNWVRHEGQTLLSTH